MSTRADALPLHTRTSEAWAQAVLARPRLLLEDHAHLERKAAANALALLPRWPRAWAEAPEASEERASADVWTRVLTGIARDEVEHLGLVLRILRGRGGSVGRVHRNPYASALRSLVRRGRAGEELLDRLLVSAIIEARSCERFVRLGAVAADDELRRLYRGLEASERGHFRVFLDLARRLDPSEVVERRFEELLAAEARAIAAAEPGPGMHSGDPTGGERAV